MEASSLISTGAFALLGLGLIFGEARDGSGRAIAVWTIVSDTKPVPGHFGRRFWGTGHTVSLVVVGSLVLIFRIAIPPVLASWFEVGVA